MSTKFPFASKLAFTIIVVILIPLFFAVMWIFSTWTYALEKQTNDYLRNIGDITMSKLENSVEYVVDTANFIKKNEQIKQGIANENNIILETGDKYENYLELTQILSSHASVKDEILAILIQSKNKYYYNYSKEWIRFRGERFPKENFYNAGEWSVLDGKIYYTDDILKYSGSDKLGTLLIAVKPSVFYDLIKDIDYSGQGEIFLINEKNQIIASKNREEVGHYIPTEYSKLGDEDSIIYTNIIRNDIKHNAYLTKASSNGWKLLLSIPEEQYIKNSREFKTQMYIFLATIGIAGIVAVIMISRRLTKPIKVLATQMSKVQLDKFEIEDIMILENKENSNRSDEISMLRTSFHIMLTNIQTLIKSEYEQKVMKKEAEIKSLQMQINPHFLYNTLDTINWMARGQGFEDIGNITSSLGKLMRYSLSKKEFVTVREEINNLKDYVEIQDVRYGDKVSVHFEVDESVEKYLMPKLLIQPMVENAITHGIEDKIDDSTIYIRVIEVEEEIHIIVEDDGVGMSGAVIEGLMSDGLEPKEGHTSIGIHNVNQRIKMIYGVEYGMQIQSVLGAGTKITLRIGKII